VSKSRPRPEVLEAEAKPRFFCPGVVLEVEDSPRKPHLCETVTMMVTLCSLLCGVPAVELWRGVSEHWRDACRSQTPGCSDDVRVTRLHHELREDHATQQLLVQPATAHSTQPAQQLHTARHQAYDHHRHFIRQSRQCRCGWERHGLIKSPKLYSLLETFSLSEHFLSKSYQTWGWKSPFCENLEAKLNFKHGARTVQTDGETDNRARLVMRPDLVFVHNYL